MALLSVPVIDIAPALSNDRDGELRVATAVNRACEDIGFLVVTGHGVDPALCAEIFRESAAFFDRPLEEKLKVRSGPTTLGLGFSPIAAEAVAYSRLNRTPGDLKESFTIGRPEIPDEDYFHRPEALRHFAENR